MLCEAPPGQLVLPMPFLDRPSGFALGKLRRHSGCLCTNRNQRQRSRSRWMAQDAYLQGPNLATPPTEMPGAGAFRDIDDSGSCSWKTRKIRPRLHGPSGYLCHIGARSRGDQPEIEADRRPSARESSRRSFTSRSEPAVPEQVLPRRQINDAGSSSLSACRGVFSLALPGRWAARALCRLRGAPRRMVCHLPLPALPARLRLYSRRDGQDSRPPPTGVLREFRTLPVIAGLGGILSGLQPRKKIFDLHLPDRVHPHHPEIRAGFRNSISLEPSSTAANGW